MRTLHLTNIQFDVLRDIVKDVIDELKCDLDEETLYTTETYKIYSQLDRLQSPTVTINDKVYPEVDDIPDNIKKDWLYNKDDNYGDKVDRLVGNMVASNDNEFTHDSEGC